MLSTFYNQIGNPEYSGSTIAHETGHWLGLFHTFEGCNGDGDFVDDTPATSLPSDELYENPYCPAQEGSATDFVSDCPGVGPYMAQNIMDVNVEPCLSYFSKGQVARMRSFLSDGYRNQLTFSPGLYRCPTFDCITTGYSCGPDGCGGSCGSCIGDDFCESGLCAHTTVANEECTGAVEIPYVFNSTSYINTFASPLGISRFTATDHCDTVFNPLWFKFTTTSASKVTISTAGSEYDTVMNFYSATGGSCSSLVCQKFNDDDGFSASTISFCSVAGPSTYYIVVGGYSSAQYGQLTLRLTSSPETPCCDCADKNCGSDGCGGSCGTCSGDQVCSAPGRCVPPGNGVCTAAIEIPYVFESTSTIQGSTSPAAGGQLDEYSPCPSAVFPVWYKFTATFVSQVTISTVGSDFEAIVSVFENTCAALICVVTNDYSIVTFCPALGTNYLIAVGGFNIYEYGNLTISLTSVNDRTCCVADCTGKQCGSNGCGGSCPNLCDAGEQCVNSVCVGAAATPSRSPTPNRTATSAPVASSSPRPSSTSVSAELIITLTSSSRRSDIENAIASELNQGAEVTVIDTDGYQATVLVCDTTDADLNNLLSAFDDGSFRGTVLDGAQVDAVKTGVDCEFSSATDSNSPSSDSNSRNDVSEGSLHLPSTLLSIILLFLLNFPLLRNQQ